MVFWQKWEKKNFDLKTMLMLHLSVSGKLEWENTLRNSQTYDKKPKLLLKVLENDNIHYMVLVGRWDMYWFGAVYISVCLKLFL